MGGTDRNGRAGSSCDSRESDECIHKSHVVFFSQRWRDLLCSPCAHQNEWLWVVWMLWILRRGKIERLVTLLAACEFDGWCSKWGATCSRRCSKVAFGGWATARWNPPHAENRSLPVEMQMGPLSAPPPDILRGLSMYGYGERRVWVALIALTSFPSVDNLRLAHPRLLEIIRTGRESSSIWKTEEAQGSLVAQLPPRSRGWLGDANFRAVAVTR